MSVRERPRVPWVDGEAQVLEGIALHLRQITTLTAASAEQALEQLRRIGAVAVIVADRAGRLVAALRAAFDEVSSTRGSDGSGHADVR